MATDTVAGKNPLPIGDRWQSVVNHIGPASYTQVTPGSPPTGGDVLYASACGLKFIQAVIGLAMDSTGTYIVCGIPAANSPGLEQTSVILRWFTAASMTEVAGATNLSGKNVVLTVIGR